MGRGRWKSLKRRSYYVVREVKKKIGKRTVWMPAKHYTILDAPNEKKAVEFAKKLYKKGKRSGIYRYFEL